MQMLTLVVSFVFCETVLMCT